MKNEEAKSIIKKLSKGLEFNVKTGWGEQETVQALQHLLKENKELHHSAQFKRVQLLQQENEELKKAIRFYSDMVLEQTKTLKAMIKEE